MFCGYFTNSKTRACSRLALSQWETSLQVTPSLIGWISPENVQCEDVIGRGSLMRCVLSLWIQVGVCAIGHAALVAITGTTILVAYFMSNHATDLKIHYEVNRWQHFPRYLTFVMGIHWSPVDSPHKGQWRGTLMFSLICARTNGSASNRGTGDLRRHHADYDVTVMWVIGFFYGCPTFYWVPKLDNMTKYLNISPYSGNQMACRQSCVVSVVFCCIL